MDVRVPAPGWVRRYERGWLRGDLLAGVTVTAYLIPQVMAYAELAGLPAVAGLWAAIGALVVYAVLGSSRQLSVGPESTTALMTAAALGSVTSAATSPAALAAALAFVVAGFCLLGWIGRLAALADLLSRPVLIGYLAGIAVIMVVSQLGKLLGIEVQGDGFLTELGYAARHVTDAHTPTLALGLITLTAMLLAALEVPQGTDRPAGHARGHRSRCGRSTSKTEACCSSARFPRGYRHRVCPMSVSTTFSASSGPRSASPSSGTPTTS